MVISSLEELKVYAEEHVIVGSADGRIDYLQEPRNVKAQFKNRNRYTIKYQIFVGPDGRIIKQVCLSTRSKTVQILQPSHVRLICKSLNFPRLECCCIKFHNRSRKKSCVVYFVQ